MLLGRDTARDLGASLRELALERTGWVASGAGHLGLILFLLFGGAFTRTPLPPMEVAEVTVISEEEFALLMRPETAPEAGEGVTAPEPPDATVAPPPPRPRPELAEAEPAPAESAPAPAELSAPPPVAAAPDPPAPAPVPRVAPEAAPETPEVEEAPVVVEETAPEPDAAPEEVVEEQTPAAPAEAAPEIVTEAEQPSGAPTATPRPRARPDRVARLDPGQSFEAASEPEPEVAPEPEPEVAPEPEAEEPDREALTAAITEALSEAVSNARAAAPEQGAASGPPLSQGEQDAFRVAVERCWIVDPGSPAASVTVIVAMRMTRDAKPDTASINLLGAQGGDDSAQRTAFEAARRAILRCGADGFPLPPEKYERWAQVEMTFNPEGMRVR